MTTEVKNLRMSVATFGTCVLILAAVLAAWYLTWSTLAREDAEIQRDFAIATTEWKTWSRSHENSMVRLDDSIKSLVLTQARILEADAERRARLDEIIRRLDAIDRVRMDK